MMHIPAGAVADNDPDEEDDQAQQRLNQNKPKRESTFFRKVKSAAAKVNTGLKKGMSVSKAIGALNDAVRRCLNTHMRVQC